jgi:uncharacterized membrane protein (DUF4010 family)
MDETQTALYIRFGVALLIGFLIGLQRERSYEESNKPAAKQFAGVRTFSLFGLAGCAAAFAADLLSSEWVFITFVLIIGAIIAVAYLYTAFRGDAGMTTEVAAVLTILMGGLAYWDQLELAVALAVVTAVLLTMKLELRGLAARLTQEDMVAALKFAVITAIILPVLPNEPISDQPPFDVLNPYKVWLMVVLISGISFLGYVLFKVLGTRRGLGLTGFLGGLVSSTATTLSFSERSQQDKEVGAPFALAILIAWSVMFIRILIEVAAVNRALLPVVAIPIAAALIASLVYTVVLYFASKNAGEQDVQVSNPFELRKAITFGLLYGVILVVARAAQVYLGEAGIYASSILSGLADVDAITLSMAELSGSGNVAEVVAARAIVLAGMANTVVKGGVVLATGSVALKRSIWPGFVLILVAGIVVALLLR